MRGRTAVLALAALAVASGCGRTPELTDTQMLRILEDPKAMPPVRPELVVGERLAGCPYFWRTNGRVSFGKPACDTFDLFSDANGSSTVVLLQQPRARRIVTPPTKAPAPGSSADHSAVFEWEWVTDDLPDDVKACFDLEPRQGMAVYTLADGRWTLKTAVIEKLAVKPFTCPAF